MSPFCEFNMATGQIIRRGICVNTDTLRVENKDNAIAFVLTNSTVDTVSFGGIGSNHVAIKPIVHKATNAAIEAKQQETRPLHVDPDDMPALVTLKQWRDVRDFIETRKQL